MYFSILPLLLVTACSFTRLVQGRKVFAHYMVGNTYENHVHQDVSDAAAMGLDGFALNIGDPTTIPISRSSSVSTSTPPVPLTKWKSFLSSYNNQIYFCPDFDGTLGYYDNDPGWWAYWGTVVNCLFSWESAWPERAGYDGSFPGDISPDTPVNAGAYNHSKPHMMPLSTLQYKNSYHTKIYRGGELNFPTRMANILAMSKRPDYVQFITWNDGPESHYIGNLWTEQNNDTQPGRHATQLDAPHNGWRSLLTSFIIAFKTGHTRAGAIWYKTQMSTARCPNEGSNEYTVKPEGFSDSTDSLNWAVVVPAGTTGYKVRLISGGQILQTVSLTQGLNYGSAIITTGFQRMELLDASGAKIGAAAGGRCVTNGCPDCIFNMNPQVVGLQTRDPGDIGQCPSTQCSADDYYPPGAIWGGSRPPLVQCLPPCTIVLPPFPLPRATTVSWPKLTTTLLSISGTVTYTKTTTIVVPALTTSYIEFWPVSVDYSQTANWTFTPVQSVMPPPFTISLNPNVAPFPPSQYPTSSPTTSSTLPPILWITSSHALTIQPQPTISLKTSSIPIPSVTYRSAKPTATCTSNCGRKDCKNFGCPGSDNSGGDSGSGNCGLFGCNGGCAIWGCGGGCGLLGCGGPPGGCTKLFGCSNGCPLTSCGGPGCAVSGSCGCTPAGSCGGEGRSDEDNEPQTCTTTKTATEYLVSCTTPNPTSTSCTTIKSKTTTGCSVQGTTSTTSSRSCSVTGVVVDSDDDHGEIGNHSAAPVATMLSCAGPKEPQEYWIPAQDAADGFYKFCNEYDGQSGGPYNPAQPSYQQWYSGPLNLPANEDPTGEDVPQMNITTHGYCNTPLNKTSCLNSLASLSQKCLAAVVKFGTPTDLMYGGIFDSACWTYYVTIDIYSGDDI
ncbi:glycoside hydrolase family 71 protein [Aulographum hederae CBS 113979]|uniref:Glycoside hydrolase family 71 protein n=1 Tax=Aulographum hederae CBS 113979 TaxID=1176131 RepID=A0A6G1GXN8_9PEZI|nr:glycoside hydrolase family 71 protein [Aulographum hederae CBS 113979]